MEELLQEMALGAEELTPQVLLRECALQARLNPDRLSEDERRILYGRALSPHRETELKKAPFRLSAYQRQRVQKWIESARPTLETQLVLLGEYLKTKDMVIPPEFSRLRNIGRRAGIDSVRLDTAVLGAVWLGKAYDIINFITRHNRRYDAVYRAFEAEAASLT